jgi:hypothetical protein
LKLLDCQFSESIFLAETQADDPSGASRKFEHRMTNDRIKAVVGFVTAEFSPLIGFLVLSWTFGLKVAIAGTLAIVVVDTGWRLWQVGSPLSLVSGLGPVSAVLSNIEQSVEVSELVVLGKDDL